MEISGKAIHSHDAGGIGGQPDQADRHDHDPAPFAGDRIYGGHGKRGLRKLHGIGAKNVVLTGVSFSPDELGSAVSDGSTVQYDFNPKLEKMSHGTGDVYASVFAGAVLRGKTALEAAALAADVVCEAIKATDDDHWYGVSFERAIPFLVERLA